MGIGLIKKYRLKRNLREIGLISGGSLLGVQMRKTHLALMI
jgi:hypothetical protein